MEHRFRKLMNFIRFSELIDDDIVNIMSEIAGKTGRKFVFELSDDNAVHFMCSPSYKIKSDNGDILCDAIVFSNKKNKLFAKCTENIRLNDKPMKDITHVGMKIENMEETLRTNETSDKLKPTSFFYYKKNGQLNRDDVIRLLNTDDLKFDFKESDMQLKWISVKTDRNIISFYNDKEFFNSIKAMGFIRDKCQEIKREIVQFDLDEISDFLRCLYSYFRPRKLNFYFRKDFPLYNKDAYSIDTGLYFEIVI